MLVPGVLYLNIFSNLDKTIWTPPLPTPYARNCQCTPLGSHSLLLPCVCSSKGWCNWQTTPIQCWYLYATYQWVCIPWIGDQQFGRCWAGHHSKFVSHSSQRNPSGNWYCSLLNLMRLNLWWTRGLTCAHQKAGIDWHWPFIQHIEDSLTLGCHLEFSSTICAHTTRVGAESWWRPNIMGWDYGISS